MALDRVRDPGNLGTIIRTADAAGASGVILIGDSTDPFAMETVRATMGSIFALPLVKTTVADFLGWKSKAGVSVVATHLAGAVDYRTVDYKRRPVVVLMGNEQSGLPEELASRADMLARIPQAGLADSLIWLWQPASCCLKPGAIFSPSTRPNDPFRCLVLSPGSGHPVHPFAADFGPGDQICGRGQLAHA